MLPQVPECSATRLRFLGRRIFVLAIGEGERSSVGLRTSHTCFPENQGGPLIFDGRTLVVSPHTDDAELGAGGLIHRLTSQGKQVKILHLSDTTNLHGKAHGERLRKEAIRASGVLGVSENETHILDFPTRFFAEQRQRLLDCLVEVNRTYNPDLVLCPGTSDKHQDHEVVASEVMRAFSAQSILGFDTHWNQRQQSPVVVVGLGRANLDAKIQAASCYESQKAKAYMAPDVLTGQARMRGISRGFEFAEAFEPIQITAGL